LGMETKRIKRPIPVVLPRTPVEYAAAAFLDLPVIKVRAVFRRRTDIGDELEDRVAVKAVQQEKGHTTFARERARGVNGAPVKVGMFGLEGSGEYHRSARSRQVQPISQASERALLVQSTVHNTMIREYAGGDSLLRHPLEELVPGVWGENLLFGGEREGEEGLHSGNVCIGDRFDIVRRVGGEEEMACRLEVASPRRPCSKVDTRHGNTFTKHGIRAQCARTGHAGWFMRVIIEGDIMEGDEVRLVQRPWPHWTLLRVSSLLYGDDEAVMHYASRAVKREEWKGTEEELEELALIRELAVLEYKDELFNMLNYPATGLRYAKKDKSSTKKVVDIFTVGLCIVFAYMACLVLNRLKYF
jgi:MOSC domain-containing protein YiiM